MNNKNNKICIVSLGSNTDSSYTINRAIERLTEFWPDIEFSTKVYTRPIGLSNSGPFLNLVGRFKTSLAPLAITSICKEVESALGRDRQDPNCIAIDIDLIQWGDAILKPCADILLLITTFNRLLSVSIFKLSLVSASFMIPSILLNFDNPLTLIP